MGPLSKGNQVNIPEPEGGYPGHFGPICGNKTELGNVGKCPGKSSLLLLTT